MRPMKSSSGAARTSAAGDPDRSINPLSPCSCCAGFSHPDGDQIARSEEHTSELQSLMRISYAVFCLKKKKKKNTPTNTNCNVKDIITREGKKHEQNNNKTQ